MSRGEPRAEPRVCIVDGWRRFESADGSAVCRECELRMAAQLDALGAAVPLLGVVAMVEPTRRGTLNLEASDLSRPGAQLGIIQGEDADQIGHPPVAAWLAWWAERWSDRAVWSAGAASLAPFVKRCLSSACRESDLVAVFAAELRLYYAATRRALGRGAEPVRYTALCPRCHARALRRPSGADWIECGQCRRLFEESMLPELARASLYWDMEPWEPLTLGEAAMATGINFAVLRQWHQRGKLVPDVGPWGGTRFLRVEVDWTAAIMQDRERTRAAKRLRRLELRAA